MTLRKPKNLPQGLLFDPYDYPKVPRRVREANRPGFYHSYFFAYAINKRVELELNRSVINTKPGVAWTRIYQGRILSLVPTSRELSADHDTPTSRELSDYREADHDTPYLMLIPTDAPRRSLIKLIQNWSNCIFRTYGPGGVSLLESPKKARNMLVEGYGLVTDPDDSDEPQDSVLRPPERHSVLRSLEWLYG